MYKLLSGGCVALLLIALVSWLATPGPAQTEKAENGPSAGPSEPAPPPNQTYIGQKRCSSCHFEQFLVWRKDKHAKAFEILPAKYRNDASCLKCHTTGFGHPTGYKSASDTSLAGVTCEACHGPGSKHEEACKPFARATKLSAQQEKLARDTIYKMLPQNVCVTCHDSKAHRAHPKYDKQ